MSVTVIAMMSAAVVKVSVTGAAQQGQSIDKMRAFYIAEAGIAEAFLAVAQGRSGAIADPERPAVFGGGVYWVEATQDVSGKTRLESHGLSGSGRFSLAILVDRRVHPLGALGMGADGALVLGASASAVGVDSGADAGGGPPRIVDIGWETPATRLSSNGDMVLEDLASVAGDIRVGPEGVALIDPGATFTGSVLGSSREFRWPRLLAPAPETLELEEPIGATSTQVEFGRRSFDSIDVLAGAVVQIVGPATVVTRALRVRRGGTLTFDTSGGAVELHVLGSALFDYSSTLSSPTGQSASVGVFLHPPSIPDPEKPAECVLASNGTFHGILWAPGHKVTIGPRLVFAGAIAAGDVALSPGGSFTYDHATRLAAVGVPALPRQEGWYMIAVPDEPITKQRRDPLDYLASLGVTPIPSSQAAAEDEVRLEYVDINGDDQVYAGPPGGIVWADVQGVTDLQWVDPGSGLPTKYDDGLGTMRPVPAVEKVGVELADDTPVGGIRPSFQAGLDAWPIPSSDLFLKLLPLVPYSAEESTALMLLAPLPDTDVLRALSDAHLAAGGAPW